MTENQEPHYLWTTSGSQVEYPGTSKMSVETYIYKLKHLWQRCQEVLLLLYCFALTLFHWSCQKSLLHNTINLKLAGDYGFLSNTTVLAETLFFWKTQANSVNLPEWSFQWIQCLNDHLVPGTMEGKVQVNVVRCCIVNKLSSEHMNYFVNPLCFRALIYFSEAREGLFYQQ